MVRPHFRLYVPLGPERRAAGRVDGAGSMRLQVLHQPALYLVRAPGPVAVVLAAESFHPAGGVNVVMADGSVHFVKNQVDLSVWRALSTTQGGEIISADSY